MDQNIRSKSAAETHVVNRSIRAPKVLCIDKDNVNLGVISTYEALKLAEDNGLDLVQVNWNGKEPPTCKILNYGKFKYEASKKQKLAAKHQRESEIKVKEIKFRPATDLNDLRVKAKHAEDFLNEGFRVKVCLVFKGREISHQNFGMETFDIFISLLPGAQFLNKPSMEGKEMSVILFKKSDSSMDKTG